MNERSWCFDLLWNAGGAVPVVWAEKGLSERMRFGKSL